MKTMKHRSMLAQAICVEDRLRERIREADGTSTGYARAGGTCERCRDCIFRYPPDTRAQAVPLPPWLETCPASRTRRRSAPRLRWRYAAPMPKALWRRFTER